MCLHCNIGGMNRRRFLGAAAAALLVPRPSRAAGAASTTMTPQQALEALKAANADYVARPQPSAADRDKARPAKLAAPPSWASILACSDCRAEPDAIFGGRTAADLFVARNAGNLLDASTLSTAEYGAAVLRTPLLMVLAHTNCATVKAACEFVDKPVVLPGSIGRMIHVIIPAAMAVKGQPGDFATNAAKESARRTAKRLERASSLLASLVKARTLNIVTAILDDEKGAVSYFD
jgi:carbonic anhydrase